MERLLMCLGYPQTYNAPASAFQVLEIQTGTGIPMFSYCLDAGKLSMFLMDLSGLTSLKHKSCCEKENA